MSRHQRIGAYVGGLGALVLIIGLASGVAAVTVKHPKPSIDDILGVWSVTWTGTHLYPSTGEKNPLISRAVCTMTKVDSETVNMHFDGDWGIWDELAHYSAGILAAGKSDDDELGSWAGAWYSVVSGKVPKFAMQGPAGEYNLGRDWLWFGTMKGTRLSP
jgi:hypothetical protein